MHVSCKKNLNTVIYKYYKVKSLLYGFSDSQVPQPRTISFLYNQENFNIFKHLYTILKKEIVLFCTLHALQDLAFPPNYH